MEVMAGEDGRTDGPEPAREGLSEDAVFSLLAAPRRRAVLRTLEEDGGAVPLSALTRRVAQAEGIAPDADAGQFKKVYVSLYQTHVPALAAEGVVEYDGERKTVRLTPRAAPLLTHLDLVGSGSTGTKGLLSRLFGHDHPAN